MKNNQRFFFLDKQEDFNKSTIVIFPVPFERTTSYKKGTVYGPEAILKASAEVEFYDEELESETFTSGIHTMQEIKCRGSTEKFFEKIRMTADNLLRSGKFIVALGGEHSITPALVQAHKNHYRDLSVLIIDAHADLRSEYQGSSLSHACTSFQTRKYADIVITGIRAYSKEEAELIRKEKIKVYPAHIIKKERKWISHILNDLTKHVYLSFDLDGLDPSIMPAVGTPVPGGLDWWEAIELIKNVAANKKIVGMDFVELCPLPQLFYADFTAAKLIYKALGYIFSRPR